MSTSKPNNNSQQKPVKFLGAEYMGRKEVVRRSPNYGVTISSIRQAFPKLRTVSAERIAISAYLEELDDTLHISEHIWPDVLPDIKHVTVVLDSADPEVTESQAIMVATNLEPSVPPVQQVPAPISSPVKYHATTIPRPENLPDTLPLQPPTWRGLDGRNIIIACFGNRRKWIMTKPSTTIEDLKTYIRTGLHLNKKCEFRYGELDISDRRTVAELRMLPRGCIQISEIE